MRFQNQLEERWKEVKGGISKPDGPSRQCGTRGDVILSEESQIGVQVTQQNEVQTIRRINLHKKGHD
jgi:hypothetical protein